MDEYESRLSFFFRTKRDLNIPLLYELISNSARENLIHTFMLSFHLRDCKGKGERKLGRYALVWLFINYPDEFRKVVHLIPIFGRWDDIFEFFPVKLNLDASNIENLRMNFLSEINPNEHLQKLQCLQQDIVLFVCRQLFDDKLKMLQGQYTSICCKWIPTEGGKLDKAYGIFSLLAKSMKITRRQLRKDFITPLRSYNRIVEKYICSKDWLHINYNEVPKTAHKKLKNIFSLNDNARYFIWDYLKRNDPIKNNQDNLDLEHIVKSVRSLKSHCKSLEKWNSIVQDIRNRGSLKDYVVVLDTSSSMYNNGFSHFDNAVALALLISETNFGPFKNHLINFHSKPQFTILPEGDLFNRLDNINKMSWSNNLKLANIYQLILEHCLENKIQSTSIPKKILILTDNPYEQVKSNISEISKKYVLSGYELPKIIYWNIKDNDNLPVVKKEGKIFLSGFSKNLLNSLLYNEELTSETILKNILNDTRYTIIRTCLA